MGRLMIATVLLLVTASMPAWAQSSPAGDLHNVPQTAAPAPAQPAAMPMINCGGNSGATIAEGKKTTCSMPPDNMKSGESAMPMHHMMRGMMQGQPQSDVVQPKQIQGDTTCCGSRARP